MSQRFNLKVDQMRQNSAVATDYQDEQGQSLSTDKEHYPSYGNVRNLCFIWPNGRMLFLNYSYLIAAESNTVFSEMNLIFSTHIVTLKGFNLQMMFFDLMDQRLRLITCIEERYLSLQPEGAAVICEIFVKDA